MHQQNTQGSLEIEAHWSDHDPARRQLPLSAASCWGKLLGAWPLPCAGAIDTLATVFDDAPTPERVVFTGCPSACLLPVLWARSIWFTANAPELIIRWTSVDDPTGQHGRQAAGKLACSLVDSLVCDDPSQAWRRWGVNPAHHNARDGEAFDLLTNIVDLWDTDLHKAVLAGDWTDAVRRALLSCASLGHRRVGIYGAGTHTRAVGDALLDPGVELACIIDDDARRHGETMWGFPIVSVDTALTLGLDAVVISANSIEDLLWERAARLRESGIVVMRLYGGAREQHTTTMTSKD